MPLQLVRRLPQKWIWSSYKGDEKPTYRRSDIPLSVLLFLVLYLFNTVPHILSGSLPMELMMFVPLILIVFVGLLLLQWCITDKQRPEEEVEIAANNDRCKETIDIEGGLDTVEKTAPLSRNTNSTAEAKAKKPKKKVAFINNIKIFLTCIVLFHHILIMSVLGETGPTGAGMQYNGDSGTWWQATVLHAIVNINQSYFMGLFFAFSGYFVPRSFDRKGIETFLHERLIRLGIPFTLYFTLLAPVFSGFKRCLLTNGSFSIDVGDSFNVGPTWFLSQLLVFNIAYAIFCGKGWAPRVPYPNTWLLILLSVVVGILSTFVAALVPGDSSTDSDKNFIAPRFWNQYPSYIILFFGGALAQRNGWIESMRKLSIWTRVGVYTVFFICVGWKFIQPFIVQPPPPTFTEAGQWWWNFFMDQCWLNSMWIPLDLGVTFFFMDFVDWTIPYVTDFFAKSMYTAYIIQYLFPFLPGFYAAVALANAQNWFGTQLVFTMDQPVIALPSDDYVLSFVLLISVITFAFIWPVSYGIRSIPGFDKVL